MFRPTIHVLRVLLPTNPKYPKVRDLPEGVTDPRYRNEPGRDRKMQGPRNLLARLMKHDAVHASLGRALQLRPFADRFVALAKKGDYKEMLEVINEPFLVEKALVDFPYRFAERNGFYTRVTPLMSPRNTCIIEFVDRNRSFDRLYPPLNSYDLTPVEDDLLERTKLGRWADVANAQDELLGKDIRYARHPNWAPEDDDMSAKEMKLKYQRGIMIGRNAEEKYDNRVMTEAQGAFDEQQADYFDSVEATKPLRGARNQKKKKLGAGSKLKADSKPVLTESTASKPAADNGSS